MYRKRYGIYDMYHKKFFKFGYDDKTYKNSEQKENVE